MPKTTSSGPSNAAEQPDDTPEIPVWTCEHCDTHNIAGDLTVCPNCGAARDSEPTEQADTTPVQDDEEPPSQSSVAS